MIPGLAYAVPRGFEDVASVDILRFLPSGSASLSAIAANDSGYVLVHPSTWSDLQGCLAAYDGGQLWSVTRCLILIGEDLLRLPEDLHEHLDRDRRALPSKRSRRRNAAKAAAENSTRVSSQRESLRRAGSAASEQAFLRYLGNTVDQRRTGFDIAVQAWRHHKYPHVTEEQMPIPKSFAARFERRELLFPSLRNQDVARELGEYFSMLLVKGQDPKTLKTSLDAPDLELVAELVRDGDLIRWTLVMGIALPQPSSLPRHRSVERIPGRTSLLPARAYCLCLLHPSLTRTPDQSSIPLFFLDPCSGLGSIPLELAALAQRDGLPTLTISADNERPSLVKAAENISIAYQGISQGLSGLDQGVLWDGRSFPVSSGFRDSCIDGIVTDLPWGLRELSSVAVARLYPSLLRTLGRACREGAQGVFMLWRDKIFLEAVKQNERAWRVVDRRPVNVNGVTAHVFVLERIVTS